MTQRKAEQQNRKNCTRQKCRSGGKEMNIRNYKTTAPHIHTVVDLKL